MNYKIIFYHSGQTAEIEQTVSVKLEKTRLKLLSSVAAVTPSELAKELSNALTRTDIVFIVGGLDGGVQSTDSVLSTVLSASKDMKSQKLVDDDDNIVYMIRCKKQTIIVFPDDVEVIQKMLNAKVVDELKKVYQLHEEKSDNPSMEKITKDLDTQLSQNSRVRTHVQSDSTKQADIRNAQQNKILIRMKFGVIGLLGLGCVQLLLAVTLFLTNL